MGVRDGSMKLSMVARVAATTVLVPVLTACSLVTTVWGPPAGFLPLDDRPLSPTGLRDYRGVVHCHSFRSHDSTGTIEEIGAACESVGMDFLIMTDHPSPYSVSRGKRGMVGRTLFLVGAELRVPGGTLLAFPLKHYVRPHDTLQEYLDDIHGQGGLAFVGHAERFTAWDHPGIDGIEIHNLHAAAKAAAKIVMILKTLFTPLSVLFTELTDPNPELFARWDTVNAGRLVPVVGGNDAHANIRLPGTNWALGSYTEVFRVLSTHVLAERLDQASIVAALRAGRTFVVMDHWRDGSGFVFWAEADGVAHEMGATVPRSAVLKIRSPVRAELRLLRGGEVVATARAAELTHRPRRPGVYRVEALVGGHPWIFSSPIRVK